MSRSGFLMPLDQRLPRLHVRLGLRQVQVLQDDVVEALVAEAERHFVDRLDVPGRDDGLFRHVAEERDLLLDVGRQLAVGAAEQDVRLDADRPQVADAVLGRLRLQLAGRADERHQRQVDVERVLAAEVLPQLADGLEERLALDVAHGAADLDDDDVDVLGDAEDALLDLVGDVGNDLDGAPEVVAAPLLLDDRQVDPARRPVVVARGPRVGEALVVPQVQVGLGPVVGDVDLAVLVRAHRAGVDVDVGVELLERDPVAVPLEQAADRRRRQPLAERRHHAAGDEDVLHGVLFASLHVTTHGSRPSAARRRTRSRSSGVSTETEV